MTFEKLPKRIEEVLFLQRKAFDLPIQIVNPASKVFLKPRSSFARNLKKDFGLFPG